MHRETNHAVQDRAAALQEKAAVVQAAVADKAAVVQGAVADRAAAVQEVVADKAVAVAGQLRDASAEARGVLGERLRDGEHAVLTARDTARDATDRTLRRLGRWLVEGRTGERLGVAPARRRVPSWVLLLAAAAAGFTVAQLLGRRDPAGVWNEAGDLAEEPADLTPAGPQEDRAGDVASPMPRQPLEDTIRMALQRDPRTAGLADLNINVVDSTVFVRGVVPLDYDESALRAVLESVEGVAELDLQVSVVG